MKNKDIARTQVERERDDIALKQLELDIKKARLNLQELELNYTELQGKLEVRRIMEDDKYNHYNVVPCPVEPDAEETSITPPPGPVEELYTTVGARLSTIADTGIPHEFCPIPVTPPGFKTLVPLPFSEDILKPIDNEPGHKHKGLEYDQPSGLRDSTCILENTIINKLVDIAKTDQPSGIPPMPELDWNLGLEDRPKEH